MVRADKHRHIYYLYGTQRVTAEVDNLIVQALKSRSLLQPDGSGRLMIKLPPGVTPDVLQQEVKPCKFVSDGGRRRLVCVIDPSKNETVLLPIVLHRPLPDGEVASVNILRRMRADKPVYSVQFEMRIVADVPEFDGRIAVVNYDCRLHELAVDVATIWTEESVTKITLPPEYMSGWDDWAFVAKMRETSLSVLLGQLAAAAAPLHASDLADDPQFLRLLSLLQAEPGLPRAVSVAKYVQGLVQASPGLAVSGSLQLLLNWYQEDRRRWQHACRLHERLTSRRLDIYFNAAAKLRKAVTAVFWLAKQTVLADADDSRVKHGGASTLHRVLSQRFPQRYVPLVFPPGPSDSTTVCTLCGSEVSLANKPIATCVSCNRSWDVEQLIAAESMQQARSLVADGIFNETK